MEGYYEILNYIVNINDNQETRQKIVYYNLRMEEITACRYYGSIEEIPVGFLPKPITN